MNQKNAPKPETVISLKIIQGSTFQDAEKLVAAYSPQLSEVEFGVVRIPILELETLLTWAPEDALWVAAHAPYSPEILLGVLAPPDSTKPAARFYFTAVRKAELDVHSSKLPALRETHSLEAFLELAQSGNYVERLKEYENRNSSAPTKLLMEFFEGRAKATITKGVHFFDTDGSCLVCGKSALQSGVSTTISMGSDAQTIALSLCAEHQKASAEGFLLDFLEKELGIVNRLNIVEMKSEDIYKSIEKTLTHLDCDNLQRDAKKVQVTGTRKSGINVIVRCELHTDKRSYAYMVTTQSKVNLGRVDNAPDHKDQTFQWDHRHLKLPRDNRTVAPSFTVGLALLDEPTIRREIESAEEQMRQSAKR